MIDPKYIENIEQLSRLRPEEFLATENLAWLKDAIYSLINNKDEPGTEFARKLESKLKTVVAETEEQKQIYNIAVYWLIRLKTFCFWNLSQKEQVAFLREDLAIALHEGLDVWSGVWRYLDLFASPEMLQELSEVYLSALSANQQAISSEAATGDKFSPTVGGWSGQYRQFLNKKYLVDSAPASVDIVTFLNTAAEAKGLNENEREKLRGVLSIFNNLAVINHNAKAALKADVQPAQARTDARAAKVLSRPSAPQPVRTPPTTRSAPPLAPRPMPTQPRPASMPQPRPAPTSPASRFTIDRKPGTAETPRPASEASIIQYKKLVQEANFSAPPSLSGIIANAGQASGWEAGKMQMGKAPTPPKPDAASTVKPPTPKPYVAPVPKPAVLPSSKPIVSPPPHLPPQGGGKSMQGEPATPSLLKPITAPPTIKPLEDFSEKPTASAPKPAAAPPAPRIGFGVGTGAIAAAPKSSTPPPPDLPPQGGGKSSLFEIRTPADLQKVSLAGAKAAGFANALATIKYKILAFGQSGQMPTKEAANQFYRSPLYNLYVAMAVTVMNDASGDSAVAFDRVMKSQQAAGKETLTREEFMAINKLKREISSL